LPGFYRLIAQKSCHLNRKREGQRKRKNYRNKYRNWRKTIGKNVSKNRELKERDRGNNMGDK
jgi:hypothetical protein